MASSTLARVFYSTETKQKKGADKKVNVRLEKCCHYDTAVAGFFFGFKTSIREIPTKIRIKGQKNQRTESWNFVKNRCELVRRNHYGHRHPCHVEQISEGHYDGDVTPNGTVRTGCQVLFQTIPNSRGNGLG